MVYFPPVDYTSRDFASIRSDLIDLIPSFVPEWTSRSDNDFGLILLDLFAYTADGLHYYADRVANEAYLATATKTLSVLRIANLLGYTPTGTVAATSTLTIRNVTANALVVPAGTRVGSSKTGTVFVQFETTAALTVPANSTATVTAKSGNTTTGEALGQGTADAGQIFDLQGTPVIAGSISVTVTSAGVINYWDNVPYLADARPDDHVYTTSTDDLGVTSIVFGDSVNGAIPDLYSTINATYRTGGGSQDNISAGLLDTFLSAVPAGLTVSNAAAAAGGVDAESVDSIRSNAPASLRSQRRAVSLADYSNLAVTVASVAKANAVAAAATSVTVYIAPQGGGGVNTDLSLTADLRALKSTTQTYLQSVASVNVSVTVQAPTYVPVNISATIHVLPAYTQSDSVAAVQNQLAGLLSFDNVVFGDRVTLTDVHQAIGLLASVEYADITVLSFGSTGAGTLNFAANEIPILGTVTLVATGGIVA